MTKGGPGITDFVKSQLLGAGNTLYRLARASVSATAAALSLRITVSSLMSGVHIECKSMAELLVPKLRSPRLHKTSVLIEPRNLRRREIIEF